MSGARSDNAHGSANAARATSNGYNLQLCRSVPSIAGCCMSATSATNDEIWPALPYEAWKDTCATLHMWSQVNGKIAVALAPPVNHSWGISMRVTARGLATQNIPHGDRIFTIDFDLIDHQLIVRAADGEQRALPLAPRSVADFYRDVMQTLVSMALPVKIRTLP